MTLTEALNEQMKDESFKKEYEALGSKYEIISSLIDARKACNVTQNQTFTQKKSMYGIWKNESKKNGL